MDCPVCRNAMITLELAEVEIDYCTDCGGIWLDAGELQLLLDNPNQVEILLNSFKVDSTCTEKKRKCPICLKKMKKIIVSVTQRPLLIDKCPRGDGLWFDRGELKDILRAGSFDEENKVAKLLADMFIGQNAPSDGQSKPS